jgi:hypothetical protein
MCAGCDDRAEKWLDTDRFGFCEAADLHQGWGLCPVFSVTHPKRTMNIGR